MSTCTEPFLREMTRLSFLGGEGNRLLDGRTGLFRDHARLRGAGVDDQHLHPYVHAESEALSGAHLIHTLYTVENPSGNAHDPNQLFVSSYS